MSELAGRVAVVTGAGSGLGAAMARVFAEAGMAIAALDIDAPAAEATALSLAELGVPTAAVPVDVGDPDSVRAAAVETEGVLGGCHLLCANVGVVQFGAIDRLTEDDWRWVIDVNVLGTVRTVTAFLPVMRRSAGWRHIAVTASSSALCPGIRLGAYITSKFAVMGFAETLRLELAGEGIGVSILLPAGMITRHLESSAKARPVALGPLVTRNEDIDAMLAEGAGIASSVATPEHAVRNLVADLLANEQYVITHGDYRRDYQARIAEIDRAFDRMERS